MSDAKANVDTAALAREQEAAAAVQREQARARDADRKRRERAAVRAESVPGTSPEVVERIRTGKPVPPVPKKRRGGAGGDGRILGVYSIPQPAMVGVQPDWITHYGPDGMSDEHLSEDEWRRRPRESFAPLNDACVKTGSGSTTYDPLDLDDIARAADAVQTERPDLALNDIRATLSRIEPGKVFEFGYGPD